MLALPDITEVESHKLNELCHIFDALEGLFVEDPNHVSGIPIRMFPALMCIPVAILCSCICAKVAKVLLSIRAAGEFSKCYCYTLSLTLVLGSIHCGHFILVRRGRIGGLRD